MNNKNGDALPDKKMDSEKKGKIIRYLLLVFYLLFYNVSIYFIIKLLTSNFLNNLSFSNIYDSTISLKIKLFFVIFVVPIFLLIVLWKLGKISKFVPKYFRLFMLLLILSSYYLQYKNTDVFSDGFVFDQKSDVFNLSDVKIDSYYTFDLNFNVSYLENEEKIIFEGNDLKISIEETYDCSDCGLKIGKNKKKVTFYNDSFNWKDKFARASIKESSPINVKIKTDDFWGRPIYPNIVEYKDEFQSVEVEKYKTKLKPTIEKVEFIPLKIEVSFSIKGKTITETDKGYKAIVYRKYNPTVDELDKVKKESKIKKESKELEKKVNKILE